jgi:tRNA A-37 threonylcarbamoyl transferase component Bud32
MGTVYLCEHAVLRRRLAVKVLRSDLTADPELVDRFRNEAIAASRIGQENVVDVLDFGTAEDGALYYVMEALDGRSLGAAIREGGPLQVGRALDLLEQICHALAAAHARGVLHRDVKPDNVFLVRRPDGSELAKVIDFGISRLPGMEGTPRITRAGAIIGTPEYMAPEQAAGEVVDERVDVYAVGVLAFEMLTGVLPIEAATPIATLVAHQIREPDPPSRRRSSIPPEVDALVLRALAKRPTDRFGSMEAFAAEVARVRALFSKKTVSYPPRPSRPRAETLALPETRERVRRATLRTRRALPVTVGIAALALAATAAWLVLARARVLEEAAGVSAATMVTMPDAVLPGSSASQTRDDAPLRSEPDPSAATRTAPPAPVPAPTVPPARVPAALEEEPTAVAPPAAAPARPRKSSGRLAPARSEQGDDIKDPYSSEGDLKDPFK